MILRPQFEIMGLSIVAGIFYLYLIKNRSKKGDTKVNYIFAVIWIAWTILGILGAIPLIPPLVNPDPLFSPSPETIFLVYIQFVVLPQIIVLYFIVGDLTLYHVRKN
jgi:hypothetical protein